jgi:intracellular sulfur oxidation DsrE/DsrF family protein
MFKYIIFVAILLESLYAQEYKAVFDCSSNDERFIMSRMNLIEKTINMIEESGDQVKFALTIHGGCAPMVSKTFSEIVDDEKIDYIEKAQKTIERLANKKGVEIVACAMSLNANSIEQKDVVSFVRVSKNSFIDTIAYQNRGYALMTFK